MLLLIKAGEALIIKWLILCVYALPDYGKTSLALTASRPLVIDFDGLVAKAKNRTHGDVIRLETWTDFDSLEKQVDLSNYDTVVIDTCGRAVDLLKEHVKTLEMGNRQGDGNLSLKGWGVVKRLFKERLDTLGKTGKDIVLLCHLNEEKSGDTMLDRLDIDGGSKAEVYKSAMAICRIVISGKEQKRFLDFSPRENAIGKNPGGLGLIPYDNPAVAPNTLALVLKQIKNEMNRPVAVTVARPALVPMAGSPEAITHLMPQVPAQVSREKEAADFMADVNPKIHLIKKE